MTKVYQPIRDNWIPHNLYMQIIYIVRDYDRMIEEYHDILEESLAPSDGQPRGTGTGDPTSAKAQKVELLHDRIKAIEQALLFIPEEYRRPVLDNIKHHLRYPDYADRKTWSRWKGRFIQKVGENLKLL